MKGDLTLLILKLAQTAAMTVGEIADTIAYYGRDAHYKRLSHIATSIPNRKLILQSQIGFLEEKRRVGRLISKLRVEGFIKNGVDSNSGLTIKGEDKIKELRRRLIRQSYIVEKSNELKIIMFDIPEKDALKRVWLRDTLKVLNFYMLQKSVWAGNSVVPESFILDLQKNGISKCVEILAVTKHGTLKPIL